VSNLQSLMATVKADYGKSRTSQMFEIATLGLAPSHLSFEEYYSYRLFEDARFDKSAKRRFMGRMAYEQAKTFLVDRRWRILADDKFIFSTIFGAQDFPIARILATCNYGPNRRAGRVPSLGSRADLKSFLWDRAEYPLFAKPIYESYGKGSFGIASLDRDSHTVVLTNGEVISIDDVIERVFQCSGGYVFQECLRPHRAIREICGDALGTLRVLVLSDSGGARLSRACLKIPTGKNMSDNFAHGTSGNALANVDIETGALGRFIRGTGLNQEALDDHPETGKRVAGIALPFWPEAKDLCTEAARLLPGFHIQGWDVAICDKGPVLLEVQPGDIDILQIAAQRGLMDDEFLAFVNSINKNWRREVVLTFFEQLPRMVYRRFWPKRRLHV
jgi:hypothetical protein